MNVNRFKAHLSSAFLFLYLAGDLVDVVTVHQLGCGGQIDQLTSGVVVFLSVAQLEKETKRWHEYKHDSIMNNETNPDDISGVQTLSYVAEVLLVHLDLFDVGGVVGCVDLVLLLVVQLTIQALGKGKDDIRQCLIQ